MRYLDDPWQLRCAFAFDERDTFAIVREGKARFEAWAGPKDVGPGNYANTLAGHVRGAAGELVTKAALTRFGISAHRDDAVGSTWDWLTTRAALEVKTRRITDWDRYAWHANAATVAKAARRRTQRPRRLWVWAATTGPDTGPTGAEVLGWTELENVAAAPIITLYGRHEHVVDVDLIKYAHELKGEHA